MVMTKRRARALGVLLAAGALGVVGGSSWNAAAQGFSLPKQGYEATAQNPADYTPEEKEAVAVVLQWVETTNAHDRRAHQALIDDNVAYRGDPVQPLLRGAQGYCGAFGFIDDTKSHLALNELYVVGGPNDTLVLMNRTDINGAYDGKFFLGGYPVPLGTFLRIHNGKVVEWYDIPTNKVSMAALPFTMPVGGVKEVTEACKPYAVGGDLPPAANNPPAEVTLNPMPTYGTNKPEYWFKPEERAAAQAVRGWFAARKAGDPLLLAAFADRNIISRANPAASLMTGRDNLLKSICGYIGGRLDLTELFVVGGDYDTSVITRWNSYDADGNVTKMGSFFRVQDGKIVEWLDAVLEGTDPAASANANLAACETVNTTLAAQAAPLHGMQPAGGPTKGAPPAGAPPTGAPPAQ
ncbi:MAG: hypothetical protein P4M09_26760 [Devosia sp.]|nr:hypothetical protein [Devosia sp.]